jgi:hypothetical protein
MAMGNEFFMDEFYRTSFGNLFWVIPICSTI